MGSAWILFISFLIFLLQGGFTFAEIGFLRPQNTGNAVLKNIAGFALGSMGYFFIGYGLMFGLSWWGLWGTSDFLPDELFSSEFAENGILADRLLQMVLAAVAIPIVTGAMSERTKFWGYLVASALMGAFLYPTVGHWIRGDGWLARLGMIDMGGAAGLFFLAGCVSLAAILVLGPRLDFNNRRLSLSRPNVSFLALGVFILWLGWFGLNIGQVLLVDDFSLVLAAASTLFAGSGGIISSLIASWLWKGKPDVPLTLGGGLAGLVASTGGITIVSPLSIMVIGGCAGGLFCVAHFGLGRLGVDDPVGSLAVYGVGGLWGTLAVGFFAEAPYTLKYTGVPGSGLFYGGGGDILLSQILGIGGVFLFAFPVSWGVLKLLDTAFQLRVAPEKERRGLDLEEHGLSAYPFLDEIREQQDGLRKELRTVQELSLLHDIGQSMHTLNLDEILELILRGVAEGIGFDRVRLYLLDEGRNQLVCRVAVGVEREKIQDLSLPYNREDNMISRAMVERRPFIVEDARQDPRVNRDLISSLEVKSFAAVPLLSKDKVLGGIAADNLISQTSITESKLKSLMVFANQAAMALENALMYGELKNFSTLLGERVKKASEDLQVTQRQLFQSEKLAALGKISAGIAHEIRNPLTSIKILIHSLADAQSTLSSREKDMAVIEAEIERVNKMIKQFLDFARPRPPSLEPVEIAKVLEDTLLLLKHEMEGQRIGLQRRYSAELPPVPMDPEQMKQVFLNLLLNALQAMESGGTVTVTTALKKDPSGGPAGGWAEVSLADTGKGVPEEIRNRIFEPFFSTKEEGIGLGLPIAQRIVEEHGGEIRVESRPGRGTIFSILLPLTPRL
jgi:ammonium transporter, Amt family